ncbi:MAG TPA: FCD domain-containing protein [Streptosporangiaceae bacterium]|nr:FCD domain-containing protein [Streptosporangiaceae bacterium]
MLSRNVASPDWRDSTVKGHADIVRVIRAGDETAAVELIKEHISFAYERILQSYLTTATEKDSAG